MIAGEQAGAPMTDRIAETSPRAQARIAGFLYLIVIVTGGWAQLFVRAHLIVRDDAVATAANIATHALLFRLGLVADLAGVAAYIGVTAVLYRLLRPAGRELSLLAAFFSLTGCAVMAANLVNHLAPLVLLGGAHYLSAFSAEQLQALSMSFLKLQAYGYVIATIFFGLYCFSLGWLIVRSTFLPRVLGVLLVIGGTCYLANGFTIFVFPGYAAQLSPYLLAPPRCRGNIARPVALRRRRERGEMEGPGRRPSQASRRIRPSYAPRSGGPSRRGI